MKEFTTPDVTRPVNPTPVPNPDDPADPDNNDPIIVVDPIVEDFKRANVMVFLVESIYEQMKVFIQMFIEIEARTDIDDSVKSRLVILDVDFEPFRRELQDILALASARGVLPQGLY